MKILAHQLMAVVGYRLKVFKAVMVMEISFLVKMLDVLGAILLLMLHATLISEACLV